MEGPHKRIKEPIKGQTLCNFPNMFQIKNFKKLYILALKDQTVLGHSHLKEEKARTKFLVKFKSTEKKKINKNTLGEVLSPAL